MSVPCEPKLLEQRTSGPREPLIGCKTSLLISLRKLNKATETAIRWWYVLEQNGHAESMGAILALEKQISRQRKQSGERNSGTNSSQRQSELPHGHRVEEREREALLTGGFSLSSSDPPELHFYEKSL